jgi:hypothetical protein
MDRADRLRLFQTLHDLRNVSDVERTDPAERQGTLFVFRRRFLYKGRLFLIRLIVDDSRAQYGVLRVLYADHSGP